MDTLECILSHRSIRTYKPDPIPDDVLDEILLAATRGSSSGNMQTYSVIVTKDAERRGELWDMHFQQDMIKEAPVLLTFCTDWNRMNKWCRASDAEPGYDNFLCFLVGAFDAIIAAQNAALAAEARGLGICYMGTTLCATPKLIEFFELPRDVFPVTTLVIGTPAENPEPRARLPHPSIVHTERYEEFDDERIAETYQLRETEGWNRYMAYPELKEAILESGVKNLAQVYTTVKYTRETNERFSRDLLEGLRRQGLLGNR